MQFIPLSESVNARANSEQSKGREAQAHILLGLTETVKEKRIGYPSDNLLVGRYRSVSHPTLQYDHVHVWLS